MTIAEAEEARVLGGGVTDAGEEGGAGRDGRDLKPEREGVGSGGGEDMAGRGHGPDESRAAGEHVHVIGADDALLRDSGGDVGGTAILGRRGAGSGGQKGKREDGAGTSLDGVAEEVEARGARAGHGASFRGTELVWGWTPAVWLNLTDIDIRLVRGRYTVRRKRLSIGKCSGGAAWVGLAGAGGDCFV